MHVFYGLVLNHVDRIPIESSRSYLQELCREWVEFQNHATAMYFSIVEMVMHILVPENQLNSVGMKMAWS